MTFLFALLQMLGRRVLFLHSWPAARIYFGLDGEYIISLENAAVWYLLNNISSFFCRCPVFLSMLSFIWEWTLRGDVYKSPEMKLAAGIRESLEAPAHTHTHTFSLSHTHTRMRNSLRLCTHVVGANFKVWVRRRTWRFGVRRSLLGWPTTPTALSGRWSPSNICLSPSLHPSIPLGHSEKLNKKALGGASLWLRAPRPSLIYFRADLGRRGAKICALSR